MVAWGIRLKSCTRIKVLISFLLFLFWLSVCILFLLPLIRLFLMKVSLLRFCWSINSVFMKLLCLIPPSNRFLSVQLLLRLIFHLSNMSNRSLGLFSHNASVLALRYSNRLSLRFWFLFHRAYFSFYWNRNFWSLKVVYFWNTIVQLFDLKFFRVLFCNLEQCVDLVKFLF